MVPGLRGFGPLERLGFRLVVLLGLSLLPIGVIAVLQTYRVVSEANESVEAALLGETLNAAAAERRIITHTIGMADALAWTLPDLLSEPERCERHLTDVVRANDNLIFAGFAGNDAVIACASQGVGMDLSDRPIVREFLADPKLTVTITDEGAVSKQTALVVMEPVFRDGVNIGFLALSVPHVAIAMETTAEQRMTPFDILTFDASGKSLTSRAGLASVQSRLPQGVGLTDLRVQRGVVFRDRDTAGRLRIFTVVPLVRNQIFALATWPTSEAVLSPARLLSAVTFPIIMWLTSVVVAFVAVHRLVIRHIRTLRRNIRAFSASRRTVAVNDMDDIPIELREVMEAFAQMTDRILRDEADQENLLHEKDVLLKEVHHRVKNNLQLIASITNMQIRKARHPESKFVLRRLQDRVMGLATVHRSLYEASVFSEVRADALIADIARQLANSSILPGTRIDFALVTEPVMLYPDQAVPLSLLVTEAVTNAFKYLGQPESGLPWVSVSLRASEKGTVELVVANSTGAPVLDHDDDAVSGLGSQLIGAFVMQLGGQSQIEDEGERFTVRVSFDPADFDTSDSDAAQ